MIIFGIRSALLLFSFSLSVVLALVTVLRRKSPVNQAFAVWSLILAGYAGSVFLAVNSGHDLETARRWILTSEVMIYLVTVGLCFFSFTFRCGRFRWSWLWRFCVAFGVNSALVAFLLPRILGNPPVIAGEWNPIANYVNPWWPLFFVPVTCMVFLGLYNFYVSWRNVTGYRRAQLHYGFLGVGLYWVVGFFAGILPPSLGYEGVQGFSAAFSVLVTAPIAYAIVVYRLFDISVLGRRLLNLVARGVVFTGVFVLSLLLISRMLSDPGRIFNRDTVPLVAALGALAALIHGAVAHWVQRAIYNLHRGAPGDREHLSEQLAQLLRSIDETDSLLRHVLEIVCGGLEIVHAEVYVREPVGGFVRQAAEGTYPEDPADLSRSARAFEHGRDLLLRQELEFEAEAGDVPLLAEMKAADIEIALPIRERERLVGLLCLGRKYSGNIYSRQDQRFLTGVASQLGIAIENATLYSRVQEEKVYQKTILDNLPNGVLTVDLERRVVSANLGAESILGQPGRDMVGAGIGKLDPSLAEMVNETVQNERPILRREVVYHLPDRSSSIPVEVSSLVLRGFDGKAIGCLLIVVDQTRIKRMEQEVRRGERLAAVGRMAASVAHEIKNPLVSIKTFAQLLPERYGDDEFRNSFSVLADQEIDRINSLVEQLLDLVRPSVVRREDVDIRRLLEEVLALVSVECSRKRLEVVRENWETPCRVVGDPRKLKQIFMNLVQNAIQAMEESGTLTISLEMFRGILPVGSQEELLQVSPGGTIAIGVADTGPGIPPDLQETIFEPFFTTREGGTGLGLAISNKIVSDHGGKIIVDSREGEGTRFIVSLPCA